MFKVKQKVDRTLDKYKTRLVPKGFLQVCGIDFFEIFSFMFKPTTIKVIPTLVVSKGWILRQVDTNNAFLYGGLTKDVYMI